jgi:hypothetical protein
MNQFYDDHSRCIGTSSGQKFGTRYSLSLWTESSHKRFFLFFCFFFWFLHETCQSFVEGFGMVGVVGGSVGSSHYCGLIQ